MAVSSETIFRNGSQSDPSQAEEIDNLQPRGLTLDHLYFSLFHKTLSQ